MRRGATPANANVEGKRPVARKSGKDEGSRVGDLAKRLAEALKREAEASGAANGDERSPQGHRGLPDRSAAGPRYAWSRAPADYATRAGHLLLLSKGISSGWPPFTPAPWRERARLSNGRILHRAGVAPAGRRRIAQTVHVEDLANTEAEFPARGARLPPVWPPDSLAVPLLREGVPIGVIFIDPPGGRPVLGQRNRTVADLCRPGRHRDRERAAVQRDRGEEPPARGRPASTSPSSSPTCPTSCGRR